MVIKCIVTMARREEKENKKGEPFITCHLAEYENNYPPEVSPIVMHERPPPHAFVTRRIVDSNVLRRNKSRETKTETSASVLCLFESI